MEYIKVGIFGGTGYTGWALIQLLLEHPGTTIEFVTSERKAGMNLRNAWPLAPDFPLQAANQVNLDKVDCVFLCLPHTTSASIAAKAIDAGVAVIDLSADLRLHSPEEYANWYQEDHPSPDLLPVVYGLPEHYREQIIKEKVVANPGCYATAMLLGLFPLAKAQLLAENAPIIVDAKSGTTGAGRNPKQNILFSEVHGNFSPYNIGRSHRHIGEVEQQLLAVGSKNGPLIFSSFVTYRQGDPGRHLRQAKSRRSSYRSNSGILFSRAFSDSLTRWRAGHPGPCRTYTSRRHVPYPHCG